MARKTINYLKKSTSEANGLKWLTTQGYTLKDNNDRYKDIVLTSSLRKLINKSIFYQYLTITIKTKHKKMLIKPKSEGVY